MVEKVDLIATRAMTYSTRRLVADDLFQASRRDARLLVAIGKAKFVDAADAPSAKPRGETNTKTGRRTVRKPKAR